jgi:rubrerythrin
MATTRRPTVEEILTSALRKEESARDFYAKLAADCPIDFVRELLKKLENEESKHVNLIHSMQARLRAGKNPG